MELTEQERCGLREQIALDQAALDREWAKPEPEWSVIHQLLDHIDHCKAKLKE
jgi:hypothetical protein